MTLLRIAAVAGLAFGVAHRALGRAQGEPLARSVRVTAENDYFEFWRPPDQRPDDNYTQGARIAVEVASVPPLIRRLFCGMPAACGTTIEVGQELYTPTYDSSRPLPGERPYAGWLRRMLRPESRSMTDHIIVGPRARCAWYGNALTRVGFKIARTLSH